MPDVVNQENSDDAGRREAVADEIGASEAPGSDAGVAGIAELDIDTVAAEYVLGTLDSDERSRANALIESDPHFRGMVRVWERRLGELHLMVEPVEPPTVIWESIKAELDGVVQSPGVVVPEEGPTTVSAEKTRATLEALEAELREEGLTPPPEPSVAEAPAAATARAPDLEPASARGDVVGREPTDYPDQPARSWKFVAALMTLIALVLAGLIAAWRYFPERLPAQLRAEEVLNIHPPAAPPPPVRPVAPPESQFDE